MWFDYGVDPLFVWPPYSEATWFIRKPHYRIYASTPSPPLASGFTFRALNTMFGSQVRSKNKWTFQRWIAILLMPFILKPVERIKRLAFHLTVIYGTCCSTHKQLEKLLPSKYWKSQEQTSKQSNWRREHGDDADEGNAVRSFH